MSNDQTSDPSSSRASQVLRTAACYVRPAGPGSGCCVCPHAKNTAEQGQCRGSLPPRLCCSHHFPKEAHVALGDTEPNVPIRSCPPARLVALAHHAHPLHFRSFQEGGTSGTCGQSNGTIGGCIHAWNTGPSWNRTPLETTAKMRPEKSAQ